MLIPTYMQGPTIVQFRQPAKPTHTRPDLLALVGFATQAHVLVAPAVAGAASIAEALTHRLTTTPSSLGGSTNIAAGLRLAGTLLRNAPKGFRKRVWLLSDGLPTDEVNEILPQVQVLSSHYVNVNTIAFGNDADEALLRKIAATTHNGRFFQVSDVAALTTAFAGAKDQKHSIASKPELTIFVLDQSGSMWETMGTGRKIEIVQQALFNLVRQKKLLFS